MPCEELAKSLLGCVLYHVTPQGVCSGKIVETEAYLGGADKAAHSYNGRRTERNAAMYMKPGTCYVYSVYGMHNCANISSAGEGAAVLIRALEPLEGIDVMRSRRKSVKKDVELCSGPAKLCKALDVTKTLNKVDVCSCEELWVESSGRMVDGITAGPRIGVDYAEDWASKVLRFYITGNKSISKK